MEGDNSTQPTPAADEQPGGGTNDSIATSADALNATATPWTAPPPMKDATPHTSAVNPTPVKPVHRHGLAGIIDEFVDAVAGGSTSRVYQDDKGNRYIKHETPTRGQQWMRIAATAFQGAAAGAAQHGPGSMGRAGLAGFEAGEHGADQRRQNERQDRKEITQEQLDKYNLIKVQHDTAIADFDFTRKQLKGAEDDIKFSQSQIDRERELGSADLGVFRDPVELANLQKTQPNFWKDVYAGDVVKVPEISADGTRAGIHVFLRTKGVGNQLVPQGTTVWDFQPGAKPEDEPKLVARTLSAPATYNQVEAWNNAAYKKKGDWLTARDKASDTEAQAKLRTAQTAEAVARTREARSVEVKNYAEARKVKIEGDNLGKPSEDIETNAQQIAAGRMAPSQLSKRSKDWQSTMARADAIHLAKTGEHLNVEQAEINYKAYTSTIERYSNGQGATNIMSFDKFLGHALDASESVNAMRNTNVKLVNLPYNKLRELAGTSSSPALIAGYTKIETMRKEYESFLENNKALTEDDKKQGQKILDNNATPAQMQAAMKAMAGIAVVRLRSEDFGFSRVTHSHLPDLVSPEGAKALQHFGFDPTAVYSQNTQQRTQPAAAPSSPVARPEAAAGTQMFSDNREHWVDGQGKDLGIAK